MVEFRVTTLCVSVVSGLDASWVVVSSVEDSLVDNVASRVMSESCAGFGSVLAENHGSSKVKERGWSWKVTCRICFWLVKIRAMSCLRSAGPNFDRVVFDLANGCAGYCRKQAAHRWSQRRSCYETQGASSERASAEERLNVCGVRGLGVG